MAVSDVVGRTYNVSEVAAILKVNDITVHKWIKAGAPFVRRANRDRKEAWELDLAEIVKWRQDQAVNRAIGDRETIDIDDAKARKETARAGLAEIELAKARGEVVAIEVVTKVIGEQLAAVRAKLLAIPSKASPLVAPLSDIIECREVLDGLIREACDELIGFDSGGAGPAGRDPDGSDPEDDSGEHEAATETERKRVGRPRKAAVGGSERGTREVDYF